MNFMSCVCLAGHLTGPVGKHVLHTHWGGGRWAAPQSLPRLFLLPSHSFVPIVLDTFLPRKWQMEGTREAG